MFINERIGLVQCECLIVIIHREGYESGKPNSTTIFQREINSLHVWALAMYLALTVIQAKDAKWKNFKSAYSTIVGKKEESKANLMSENGKNEDNWVNGQVLPKIAHFFIFSLKDGSAIVVPDSII